MTRAQEVIAMLEIMQANATEKYVITVHDTVIENVKLDSFNWVISEAIKLLNDK